VRAKKRERRPPHEFVWVVPLRRVFPWWYLVGMVVTFAVIILAGGGNTAGLGALWGPCIGLEIQQRQRRAADRQRAGLSVERRDLRGATWIEPICAAIFAAIGAGIALTLGFIFDRTSPAQLWTGVVLLAAGGIAVAILVLWARRRNATKRAQRDREGDAHGHQNQAEDDEHVPDALAADDADHSDDDTREAGRRGTVSDHPG
jgi:hypothetical protein